MNLAFLSKTDKALHAMRDQQNADGKEARKEIKRRLSVGFADGTMYSTAKAVVETESRVGTVTIVGAR
tara:strand:+ start:545 stop:748 length:204 start_codon:yes stop_codon:yes gene_type:complete